MFDLEYHRKKSIEKIDKFTLEVPLNVEHLGLRSDRCVQYFEKIKNTISKTNSLLTITLQMAKAKYYNKTVVNLLKNQ